MPPIILQYRYEAVSPSPISTEYNGILLTNISRIPFITERVQSAKEAMQVITMRQSNISVRYIFLAAERMNWRKLRVSVSAKGFLQRLMYAQNSLVNLQAPVTFQSLHSLMSTSVSRSTFILPLWAWLLKVICEANKGFLVGWRIIKKKKKNPYLSFAV